ncbi:hypothetical protein D9758_017690 [Tetrapyrgos nigripes]|uniref:C2H2-type domain-containing protein n=1 Tax=Tetrapyrgos nigripes TaxID=182062 RepID=A0A8H5C859_9AGAR|nr:hypothetical protein D9758_017690 [Tetrapyrgos nigripes]
MSHIFTLDDLARCKVSLEFVNAEHPPSVVWQPRVQTVSLPVSTKSLSIRVNESFVNGRPSVTLFLIHDPDSTAEAEESPSSQKINSDNAQTVLSQSTTAPEIMERSTSTDSLPSPSSTSASICSASPESDLHFNYSSPAFQHEPWGTEPRLGKDLEHTSAPAAFSFPQSQRLDGDDPMISSMMSFDMFFGPGSGSSTAESSLIGTPNTFSSHLPSLGECSSSDGWSDVSSPEAGITPSPVSTGTEESGVRNHRRVRGGRMTRLSHNVCARTHPSDCNCGAVHSRTAPKNSKKRIQCSLCTETFSRRHDMMRHEATQHGKVQDWTCERCRRFFSSEAMLGVHKCPARR